MRRGGARGRLVLRGHRESAIRPHSPPAGESRRATEVPAIQKKSTNATGPCIEPLIIAPEREIHVVAVETVGHRADAMRAVETDQHAACVSLVGEKGEVEQLAAGDRKSVV